VVPEPTGHEHKKLSPRYRAFGGRASPTSGRHSNASVTTDSSDEAYFEIGIRAYFRHMGGSDQHRLKWRYISPTLTTP